MIGGNGMRKEDEDYLNFLRAIPLDRLNDPAVVAEAASKLRRAKTNGAAGAAGPANDGWPVMDPAAYHGFVGDVVEAIEPHTEADPAAILIQLLVAAGSLVGRRCYYPVEGDRHHGNLFSVLVGESAKARKGTSWGRVKAVAKVADQEWSEDRTKGGLSSGEGLINEVRDEVVKWDAASKSWDVVDPGVADKRLLIVEPEFASVLAMMDRPGNMLSQLVRKAWDGDKLATLTKGSPLTATAAHISLIGHITKDELRKRLTETEKANGFANRFIFALARRSKKLPFGGCLSDSHVLELGNILKAALDALPAGDHRVTMTSEARKKWAGIYDTLSEGKPGLIGAVTARAEAQVVRFAMIYALLDKKLEIDVSHLRAALAVWEYAEASAVHIFGASLGHPVADAILRDLRQAGDAGVSRTAIRDLFGRNQPAYAIQAALQVLLENGLARMESAKAFGQGRPTETWFAT
jgi:Protein of unknown function (DUF3987)